MEVTAPPEPQAGRRFFMVAVHDHTACRLDGPFQTDQETMADPTYVNVRERQKRVTIAVTRRSEHPHIVRVRGLGRPDKVSRIAEMDAVELRPGLAETVSADIPPQHQPYWLAVEIFRQTGEGWTTIARREATEVPHTYELDGRDVVLEIAYS